MTKSSIWMIEKVPEFWNYTQVLSLETFFGIIFLSYLKCSALILIFPRSIWYLVLSSTVSLLSNSFRTSDIKLAVPIRKIRMMLRISCISQCLKWLYWYSWITLMCENLWPNGTLLCGTSYIRKIILTEKWRKKWFLFDFINCLPETSYYEYIDQVGHWEAYEHWYFEKTRKKTRIKNLDRFYRLSR